MQVTEVTTVVIWCYYNKTELNYKWIQLNPLEVWQTSSGTDWWSKTILLSTAWPISLHLSARSALVKNNIYKWLLKHNCAPLLHWEMCGVQLRSKEIRLICLIWTNTKQTWTLTAVTTAYVTKRNKVSSRYLGDKEKVVICVWIHWISSHASKVMLQKETSFIEMDSHPSTHTQCVF